MWRLRENTYWKFYWDLEKKFGSKIVQEEKVRAASGPVLKLEFETLFKERSCRGSLHKWTQIKFGKDEYYEEFQSTDGLLGYVGLKASTSLNQVSVVLEYRSWKIFIFNEDFCVVTRSDHLE